MRVMRPLSPQLQRLPRVAAGSGPANQAGGVKILDTLAVGAVLTIQSRRTQAVQYAVEFGFEPGVNEPDTGSKPLRMHKVTLCPAKKYLTGPNVNQRPRFHPT